MNGKICNFLNSCLTLFNIYNQNQSTGKFSFKGKNIALKNMGLTDEEIEKLTSSSPIITKCKNNS